MMAPTLDPDLLQAFLAVADHRSFTRAVGTGAANAAILPQILGMAEALSLKVIVAGIEA